MRNLRQVFKIGKGPSSSHSMGPLRAAQLFAARLGPGIQRVEVELLGSLAATGRGHRTGEAVEEGLAPLPVTLFWRPEVTLPAHPNAMVFRAIGADGKAGLTWQVYSIGGGDLRDDAGVVEGPSARAYPGDSLRELLAWSSKRGQPLWAFAAEHDREDVWEFLARVWDVMRAAVRGGLEAGDALLPGPLRLRRRAGAILASAHERVGFLRDVNLLSAYALAVAEQNADGGQIVTAPTCGAAGVLPGVLYYFHRHGNAPEAAIHRALATAGLVGAVVAQRASISGAEVGCQGEIGAACAMAAAAAAQILGGSPAQVEYAAEMGLEHFLGLTCDPIMGLVQIPCIERNAFAATRAMDCAAYALATDGRHLVAFDDVVDVMKATGHDLQAGYRETARGGLARIMADRIGQASAPRRDSP